MARSEISIPTPWTFSMGGELLEPYLDGMELDLLSSHLNTSNREVVGRLSALLFKVEHPQQNPTATNYKKPWNWGESSKPWRMYAVRTPIGEIAEKLERHGLGICYRLLSENLIILPCDVVAKYELDREGFGDETQNEGRVKFRSNCLDVVVDCKRHIREVRYVSSLDKFMGLPIQLSKIQVVLVWEEVQWKNKLNELG
jgi:hypothetical protein